MMFPLCCPALLFHERRSRAGGLRLRGPWSFSGDQDGGAVDLVCCQVGQGLVRVGEVIRSDTDGERKTACQPKERQDFCLYQLALRFPRMEETPASRRSS